MNYAPFRWLGSGIFVRAVVWRGPWQRAPSMWILNSVYADNIWIAEYGR